MKQQALSAGKKENLTEKSKSIQVGNDVINKPLEISKNTKHYFSIWVIQFFGVIPQNIDIN